MQRKLDLHTVDLTTVVYCVNDFIRHRFDEIVHSYFADMQLYGNIGTSVPF